MTGHFDGIQIDLARLSPNLRAILRSQLREFIDLVDDCNRAQGLNRLMRVVKTARTYPSITGREAA